MRIFTIAAAGLFVAMSAYAQEPEPDVVVEGYRIEEAARAFARSVSATTNREDQLARFDDRVCPGVIGLNRRQGEFLADRIGRRALELNLDVGAPGCDANVLILVTQNPSNLARAIAEEQRYLVAHTGVQENIDTRGADALERFITEDRPVRWWHVAQTVSRDGQVLRNVPAQMWAGSSQSPHFHAEVVHANPLTASQTHASTRQEFRNVVIIVDATRVAAVRLDALADYVAMVAFAQIAPDVDTHEFDTVLNLFNGGGTGITDWDRAYLAGLYSVDPHSTSARQQTGRIAIEMRDTLTN
ncbi:MAG: hypothetical protein ABL871_00205 [Terricaulis sp.]